MTNSLSKENNRVYNHQFAILAFIASFTFKVVMLPQYLSADAGGNAFISAAIMMAMDMIMFFMVYYVVTRINLLTEDNKWVIAPIMLLLYFLIMARLNVLFAETLIFTSSTLFDQGRVAFIILALLPVLMYFVYKGGNNIARMAQIIFWVILAAIAFSVMLTRAEMDFSAVLPIAPDGGKDIVNAAVKHTFWFGDYIPLLFFGVVGDKNKKYRKSAFPIAVVSAAVLTVGFILIFTAIYEDAGKLVSFAFNKIAVFNKITQLIGPTNFPVIITWIFMAIIKLALMLYAATCALTYFIRKKWLAMLINAVIIGGIAAFGITNNEIAYAYATCGLQYFAAAVQYGAPIALVIYVRIKNGKSSKAQMADLAHNHSAGNSV